ncbi:hypothetical protein [Marinicella meishanensis]|nr:hypothetical protein [Marinicella sp. NBU2979]
MSALWLRQNADFIHDLLLPERVIFDFIPDPPPVQTVMSVHRW